MPAEGHEDEYCPECGRVLPYWVIRDGGEGCPNCGWNR